MVVVVRDPRDVMVSLYYHSRSITGIAYEGSWDEWFEAFVAGTAPLPMAAPRGDGDVCAAEADARGESRRPSGAPNDWFEHTLGWWQVAKASPDRVLWVRYEDMLSDPINEVRRVARLVSPGLADDDAALRRIVEASSFEEMKQRHEADPDSATHRRAGEHGHFRQGKAGDWRAHLTGEQRTRFDEILRRRLAGTGGS